MHSKFLNEVTHNFGIYVHYEKYFKAYGTDFSIF